MHRAERARNIPRVSEGRRRHGDRTTGIARTLLLAAALLPAGTAGAGQEAPALAATDVAALRRIEDACRAKAADEIARLARYCALTNAYDDARRDYAKALAFVAGSKSIKTELAAIKGRTAKPSKPVIAGIADRRKKALAKCAEHLTPAVAAWAKADRSDELAALLSLMRAQGVPVDDLLAKFEIEVYEPYLDWRTKTAIAKLDAGWEYVDGAWLDPAKVAEMDAAHSTWAKHWVFADDVHEVRTTLPQRMAKQVLAHVGAYRRFFLDYFTGEWDLVAPKVKLPVIVTQTRAEMEARTAEFKDAPPPPPNAAAYYLAGPGAGNPFFVSFEANVEGGKVAQLDFSGLRRTFEHELGHQIAYEYSKHADGNLDCDGFKWVSEGVAEFLPNYDLVDGAWTLRYPRCHPTVDGVLESAFGWCHDHAERMPTLSIFFEQPPERFDAKSYHVAAVLVCYLLEGKDREYRPRFIGLAEAVHRYRADAASFKACFEGVELDTLSEELRDFCKAIKLEDG